MTSATTIHAAVARDRRGLEAFAADLRSPAFWPGDAGYDEACRIWNAMIERRPALVVRPRDAGEVAACIDFVRDSGLPLSIRGGGHNIAGTALCDRGVMIDFSTHKEVEVEPSTGHVRVQPGASWADVDRATQPFGLVVPGGIVSATGVAGFTLGGGFGWVSRRYGFAADNLRAVEIVTADGQVRTASASENADLYWAVRGAGSNFGVVTSFELELHPVGPILQLCALFYPLEDGVRVLRGWREFTAAAPDEVSPLAVLWSVPEHEHFPEELWRRPMVVIAAVTAGSVEEGERLTQPLRELATPLMDLTGPTPYTALQSGFDAFFPDGRYYYWKSAYIDDLDDAAIDTMVRRAEARPSFQSAVTLWPLGGAVGRIGEEETAYGRRDAPFLVTAEASWDDPNANDANISWARESLVAMQPFSKGGTYLNFPGFGEEKEAQLRASYGANYDRLAALKAEYDPDNLFRVNLNIPPRT